MKSYSLMLAVNFVVVLGINACGDSKKSNNENGNEANGNLNLPASQMEAPMPLNEAPVTEEQVVPLDEKNEDDQLTVVPPVSKTEPVSKTKPVTPGKVRETDKNLLVLQEVPTKVSRRGSGLSPERYSVDVDLKTGLVEYERSSALNTGVNCKGTLKLGEELNLWKESVSNVNVCLQTNSAPQSDGYVHTMSLHYENSAALPQELKFEKRDNLKVVTLLSTYSESVDGTQQFPCKRSFDLDRLLKQKVSCLKLP